MKKEVGLDLMQIKHDTNEYLDHYRNCKTDSKTIPLSQMIIQSKKQKQDVLICPVFANNYTCSCSAAMPTASKSLM